MYIAEQLVGFFGTWTYFPSFKIRISSFSLSGGCCTRAWTKFRTFFTIYNVEKSSYIKIQCAEWMKQKRLNLYTIVPYKKRSNNIIASKKYCIELGLERRYGDLVNRLNVKKQNSFLQVKKDKVTRKLIAIICLRRNSVFTTPQAPPPPSGRHVTHGMPW